MTPAVALYRQSVRQGLPTRRTIVLLIIELFPAAVYLFATSNRTQEAAFRAAVEIGASTLFALVIPVVAIVTAAGALGHERRDLTLSFIVLRPIRRVSISLAKWASSVTAACAINAVGALLLGLVHGARFGSWSFVAGLLVGTVLATIAYCSVFVPLGFITDRAVIIGIGYLLVFENGIAFLLTGLAVLSPWRIGVSAFADIAEGSRIYLEDASAPMSLTRALIVATTYAVVGIALTTWLLRRRDLA